MSWQAAIDAWEEWMLSAGMSERTVHLRRWQLERIAAQSSRRSPWKVSTADLVGWLSRPSWAAETRKGERSAIRSFYTWAVQSGQLRRSPAEQLAPIRVAPATPRPAPDIVLEQGLAHASDRERLILLLAAYAGLRRAEIAGLRFADVAGDVIHVTGKGRRKRTVPLHPLLDTEIHTELERRRAGIRSTGYRYGQPDDGWIFPGRDGGPISPSAIGHAAANALAPGWTGHTLRHRFATRTYAVTGDILKVSKLLGHSRPETTARYAEVPNDALRAAVHAI